MDIKDVKKAPTKHKLNWCNQFVSKQGLKKINDNRKQLNAKGFFSIPSFPNYGISCSGDIVSFLSGKLKAVTSYEGYVRTNLYRNGKQYQKLVHRLVAETHIGPQPKGKPTVNHKDFNRKNNDVGNLEWASYKEQEKHKRDNKGHIHGCNNPNSFLDEMQVLTILTFDVRSLNGNDNRKTDVYNILKSRYGITQGIIRNIQMGRTYAHLAGAVYEN